MERYNKYCCCYCGTVTAGRCGNNENNNISYYCCYNNYYFYYDYCHYTRRRCSLRTPAQVYTALSLARCKEVEAKRWEGEGVFRCKVQVEGKYL